MPTTLSANGREEPEAKRISQDVWKWIATTLGAALIGAVAMGVFSDAEVSAVKDGLRKHEAQPAHREAVGEHEDMERRIGLLEGDMKVILQEMNGRLARIEAKIE